MVNKNMIMIWWWLQGLSPFWLWFDYDYGIRALDYDFLISNHNHAHVWSPSPVISRVHLWLKLSMKSLLFCNSSHIMLISCFLFSVTVRTTFCMERIVAVVRWCIISVPLDVLVAPLTLNRRRDVLNVTQKRLPYAERTFKTSPKR